MTDVKPRWHGYRVFVTIASLVVLITGGLLFFGRNREITLALSVKFTGISPKLLVVGSDPAPEVNIKGPSGLLKGFEDLQLTHEVDLASAKPGRLFIKIPPETIKVPKGVSVLEVHPASFTIDIERRIQKLVPVVPDLQNDPAPGYKVGTVVASPSRIQLTGPASMLEGIFAVRTTPIDLAGLTEPMKKKVALNLSSPHVRTAEGSLVKVEIVVQERIIEEWVETRIQASGAHGRYEISPDRIQLLLRGPENTIRELGHGSGIRVSMDLRGLKPGTHIRHAVIEPPLNTTLVEAKPEVFTVEVLDD